MSLTTKPTGARRFNQDFGYQPGAGSNGSTMSQIANQSGWNQPRDGGDPMIMGDANMATDMPGQVSGMPQPQPRRRFGPTDMGGFNPTGRFNPIQADNGGGYGGGSPQDMADAVRRHVSSMQPGGSSSSDITTLNDSFLGGKLFSVNNQPNDIRGIRSGLAGYLGQFANMNAGHETDPTGVNLGTGERIGGSYGSGIPSLNRGNIRDITSGPLNNAPQVNFSGFNGTTPETQSLDQLGPGSTFFKNINEQLNPVFAQRRAQALAQAKESAGNLTGSGFANILGNQVNKSLAEENATTLDYATRAAQAEQQRQGAAADRAQQLNIRGGELGQQAQIANQSVGRDYGITGAQLGLDASKSNQGADESFIQQLLNRGGQTLQADQMGLNRDIANQGNTQSYNLAQGQLDQNRQLNTYNTRSATNNQNAGRFSDLLGRFSTTGVGPNELVSSGGAGALAGPLGALLGQGGGIGNSGGVGALGGLLNGPGGDGTGSYGSIGDWLGKIPGLGAAAKAGGLFGAGQLAGRLPGMAGRIGKAAGTGAAIGSVIPGVGTAIGGAVGAAVPYAQKAGSWVKKHLFSDERLKENIIPIGSGLYEYNFKGVPNREVGFIAQEVQKVLPSAVRKHTSGYLQVDYNKAASIIDALNRVN